MDRRCEKVPPPYAIHVCFTFDGGTNKARCRLLLSILPIAAAAESDDFCGMQAMTASGGSHVADTGNSKPKQERDKSSMTIVISIWKRESGLMIYI